MNFKRTKNITRSLKIGKFIDSDNIENQLSVSLLDDVQYSGSVWSHEQGLFFQQWSFSINDVKLSVCWVPKRNKLGFYLWEPLSRTIKKGSYNCIVKLYNIHDAISVLEHTSPTLFHRYHELYKD